MARLKAGDRALIGIGAVALVAAIAWFAVGGADGAADRAGLQVVCQTRDGFYRVDPLDSEASYTVETPAGANRVEIADGAVDVTWADCDNQVCVDHDPISAEGEQIVCLPHGMVIEVVADPQDAAELV